MPFQSCSFPCLPWKSVIIRPTRAKPVIEKGLQIYALHARMLQTKTHQRCILTNGRGMDAPGLGIDCPKNQAPVGRPGSFRGGQVNKMANIESMKESAIDKLPGIWNSLLPVYSSIRTWPGERGLPCPIFLNTGKSARPCSSTGLLPPAAEKADEWT